ncbi:MAG: YdjY domain-containing protein [Phycisphaerales bacterium]
MKPDDGRPPVVVAPEMEPPQVVEPEVVELKEVFPHVRADVDRHIVEFDGSVPIDCHDPETPDVYLEVVACTKGTREHETLVVTDAKPSHVHAALLLAGFQSGTPGDLGGRAADGSKLERMAPTGDPVRVTIVYQNDAGETIETDAQDMIKHVDSGEAFKTKGWVFGGSAFVDYKGREVYDADGTGLLIGLATFGVPHLKGPTFGGETLGLAEVFSPEAAVDEPIWIADPSTTPKYRTPVVVRLSRP